MQFRILATTLLLLACASSMGATSNNKVIVDPPIPAPDWTLPAIENAEICRCLTSVEKLPTSIFGRLGAVPVACPCRRSNDGAEQPVQFLAISIDVVEEDAWVS